MSGKNMIFPSPEKSIPSPLKILRGFRVLNTRIVTVLVKQEVSGWGCSPKMFLLGYGYFLDQRVHHHSS